MQAQTQNRDSQATTSRIDEGAQTADRRAVESAEEEVLLQRCLANDMRAWDTLVKKYEKCVYRFAYSLCSNRDDAADIAGHVFVRVFQNLKTFRHDGCFTSWLFRIVRNTYLDMCVRPAYRSNVSLQTETNDRDGSQMGFREIQDDKPTPEVVSMRNEVARLLAHAVQHLPAYQREVLRMYHAEGISYEEIAEATGLSIGTVKSRLNRARANLRERLMPMKESFTLN